MCAAHPERRRWGRERNIGLLDPGMFKGTSCGEFMFAVSEITIDETLNLSRSSHETPGHWQ